MVLSAACASASRYIEIPNGDSTPLTDYGKIWNAASASCRNVQSMELTVVFGGHVGETRLRRTRTRTAVSRPGSLRLEGLAPFGAPLFVFVARPGEATLVLPRARQVVRGAPPRDLLFALAGLALEPDDVHALLTGCLVPEGGVAIAARAYGNEWVAVDLEGGATAYLRQFDGDSVITIGTRDDVIVEYAEHVRGLPRRFRIKAGTALSRTELSVNLSRTNINTTLDPDAFLVSVPDTFAAITLEELRGSSPIADPPVTTDIDR